MLGAFLRRLRHGVLVANVDVHRQRLAAGRFDLARRGVNRAGQLRIRLIALGGDRNVRAVPRCPQPIAKPMPRDAPVMKRVLPLSVMATPRK